MTVADLRHLRLVRPAPLSSIRGFASMPPWVLAPHLFLAIVWLRAAAEKVVSTAWWTGTTVTTFVLAETSHAVAFYEPFLTQVVAKYPVAIAVVVLLAQLTIGLLLVLNRKVAAALAAGAFLNLQFMLAGVVNPSVFYLVLTMVIALWRLEAWGPARRRRVRSGATAGGAALTIGLAPFVTTLRPAEVIADPALVLMFLSALGSAALWVAQSPAAANEPRRCDRSREPNR